MKESNAKTIKEYLIYHDKYKQLYGNNTFILMEVGSFYEVHCLESLDGNTILGSDLDLLSDLTDLIKSTRQIVVHNSEKYRLHMSGFPTHSQDKFIHKLLNANYSVVLIDQVGEHPNGSKIREVTRVLSPGTVIEEYNKKDNTGNNVICIVLNKGKDPSTKKPIYIAGLSIVDFSTGTSFCSQIESTPHDNKLWLDECFRIIHSYSPKELILCISRDIKDTEKLFTKDNLVKEFNCKDMLLHYIPKIPDTYYKPTVINELLNKIYPNNTSHSIVDYLDLTINEESRTSFVYLLQFAFEHDRTIIEKIKKPINELSSDLAVLSSNALHQLDIVSPTNSFCLMNLLNKCSTQMGKRNFQYTLLHPTTNIDKLNRRYDNIERLQKKDNDNNYICKKLHKDLKSIIDIEKIQRRIGLMRCHPQEMGGIMLSYSFFKDIVDYILPYSPKLCGISQPPFLKNFNKLIDHLNNSFNRNELIKYNTINDIKTNIFQLGINITAENLDKRNTEIIDTFKNYSVVFSKMIDDTKHAKGDNVIKYDIDEKNGIELYCTLARGKKLSTSLNNRKIIDLGDKKIPRKDIHTKTVKNKTLISTSSLDELSNEYIVNLYKMKNIITKEYNVILQNTYNRFNKTMEKLSDIISEMDISSTNATIALENCYCRPKIVASDDSFVDAEELRHPIVEKLQCNQDTPYITNDIALDNEQKGILLFGTNACGKSTLMKAIGLSLIMAQSGMFVPAFDFHFSPYKNFFTRILGNDNIYRGLSSFAVEMTELRSIFKRIDNHGLVLGDEVCHGTESQSALALVTSAIEGLCEKKSNFIFATHLHELNNMPELEKYNQVQKYHLKVVRNDKNEIEYDRKLTPGSGPPIYGLEVARAMDLDKDLIDRANKILLRLTNGSSDLIPDKPSHFNSHVNVNKCKICQESATETHHIIEQNEADEDGMFKKEGHHKNRKSNLVPLCEKCHNEVHHGKLIIKGYLKTSSGNSLDYLYKKEDTIKKCKYTDEELDIINEMKITQPVRSKAVLELKNKGINITSGTLKKYWCKNYINT